ncbi:hypothetical protein IWQ56_003943 [Coemansia nantahalensis]|nr:hypothetical protein IWQ56_003943 [Coemansia nantahalensis]
MAAAAAAAPAAVARVVFGHAHAKFQWRKWQTGSDSLQLPFALPPPTDNPAGPADAEVPDGPEAHGASDAASTVASDEDAATRQADSPPPPPEESKPGAASPEPPESGAGDATSSHPSTPQSTQTRARRTRHQKQPPTNGTPRRTRAPPAQPRQPPGRPSPGPAPDRARRPRKNSASTLASDTASPPATVSVIKELEDVQEEYRVFHALVRQAARDLWSEMGNEWPPSPSSSTRYGKRRKVA